jgi:nucleotide-binding universal stress UspA family protein
MFKHILIATDGSELATKAVATGLELAKTLAAKVTFVAVTERRTHLAPVFPPLVLTEEDEALKQAAEAVLRTCKRRRGQTQNHLHDGACTKRIPGREHRGGG